MGAQISVSRIFVFISDRVYSISKRWHVPHASALDRSEKGTLAGAFQGAFNSNVLNACGTNHGPSDNERLIPI